MTINPKVFYYPPPLSELISQLSTNQSPDYCLKPMNRELDNLSDEMLEEDVEELDENGLATAKGWPGGCSSESEYWSLINNYPGGTLERTATYVYNLLNDPKLSAPSDSLTLDTKYEKKLPLLNQTMVDLRRRDRITINGKVVYDMTVPDDIVEIFMSDWSNSQKAKHTFKECMKALHKNFHLTTNALKLSTQATLARLSRLIIPRFSNLNLTPPKLIHCGVQRINIDTREEGITRIFYHSFWHLVSMENHKTPIKYIKASVEFVIGTNDLAAGKAVNAREFERCTPFFDTFEEAEQFGAWPAEAISSEQYDKRMELFPYYKEHLHPLTGASYLKHLTEEKELSLAKCIDCAVLSRFLPLKHITMFNHVLYDSHNLISKLPSQGKFINETIQKTLTTPRLVNIKLLKLTCLGIGKLLTKISYWRFSKPSIDRHVTCYDYRLLIEKLPDDDSVYQIIAVSKWQVNDLSKEDFPAISKYGIVLTAKISESELTSSKPEEIDITIEAQTF